LKGTYRGTARRQLFVDVLVTRLEESEITPHSPHLAAHHGP
jgi:hypothetical protein